MKKENTISAEELDRMFDDGEDISEYIDWDSGTHPNLDTRTKRISVDLPRWIIKKLDKEARRVGVTRQSIIKVWLAEHVDNLMSQGNSEAQGEVT